MLMNKKYFYPPTSLPNVRNVYCVIFRPALSIDKACITVMLQYANSTGG